jgi:hypothetical protein
MAYWSNFEAFLEVDKITCGGSFQWERGAGCPFLTGVENTGLNK